MSNTITTVFYRMLKAKELEMFYGEVPPSFVGTR
jgi:hypothetical protein